MQKKSDKEMKELWDSLSGSEWQQENPDPNSALDKIDKVAKEVAEEKICKHEEYVNIGVMREILVCKKCGKDKDECETEKKLYCHEFGRCEL